MASLAGERSSSSSTDEPLSTRGLLETSARIARTGLRLFGAFTHIELETLLDTRRHARAIAIQPDYVPAGHGYSDFLAAMGRRHQAILEATKAVELDPASPLQNSQLGVRFLRAHLYDEAIEHLKEALRLDPNFRRARERLGMSYWLDGATVEAVESARQAPPPAR